MHQNDTKYFEFSTVEKPGEVNRRPDFMILLLHQLVTKAIVTTGVWFLYEARLCIRDLRSRAHRLLEHSRYTEASPE